MRKSKIVSLLMCGLLLFGGMFSTFTGKNNAPVVADTTVQEEKLIADFETFRDCTKNVIYANLFGRFQANTDSRYVSNGNGSIRLNPIGDAYMSANLPNMQIRLQDEDRDLTKLKRVTADFYNATDHDYEIGIFFKIGKKVESDTRVTKITLKKGEWTKVSKTMDVAVLSLCNDMTDVNSVCFEFETCYDESKPNDIYMDNVRFEFSNTTPQTVEMKLDENEFCSFDKLYQKEVFTDNYYAVMNNYGFTLSLNSDLQYSRNGKSLKMHAPICPEGMTWGWPNVGFAENLIKAVDFSQYDGNDEFSFWVYNTSNQNLFISLDFWRTYTTGKRSFTKTLYPGWNNISMTFDEINADDGGLDVLTDNLTLIRICMFKFTGVDAVDLYFDDMEIIVNENE